jgi:uncharacterized protein (UPF0332 family)
MVAKGWDRFKAGFPAETGGFRQGVSRCRGRIRVARSSSRLVWNRAYYACFDAATAVFVARDRRFRKHRGLIKAVHEDLVAEGFLAAEQTVAFEGLYAQRLDADYGDFLDIPREQVENTLATARRFVAAMQSAVDATRRP